MKTKRLFLISCCAAAALIASPAFGEEAQKVHGYLCVKAAANGCTDNTGNP